jgi:hypothetical protein
MPIFWQYTRPHTTDLWPDLPIKQNNQTDKTKSPGNRRFCFIRLQAVEKPASLVFFDNKRKKDFAAAAAPEETGGRNEFRHPLKYDFLSLFARSRTPPTKTFRLRRKGRERRIWLFLQADKTSGKPEVLLYPSIDAR